MTRLFTDGAEAGDTLIWLGGNILASTEQKRTGNYSYKLAANANATMLIPQSSEIYIRFGWYNATGDTKIMKFMNGSTALCALNFTSSDYSFNISVNGGSTYIAKSLIKINNNAWHLIEVHIKIADSNGIIELRIDGELDSEGRYIGDTKPGAETTITGLYFGWGSGTLYLDDIAINDINGTVDNTWCGDGHVINLAPNDNGDSSQFVGNDSNSVDNYLLVDEVPSDGDTTYVQSATPDAKDLYNLNPSGLPADYNILNVWPEARVKDTTTGAGTIKLLVKTEGIEYESPDINLSTAYAKQIGTLYNLNPNTGSPWTTAQLDALQVGIKVVD